MAHLVAGEVAYRQLGLDRVLFMPAGSPWQKAERRVSEARHRWAMTELATNGVDYFFPDNREVHRDGWTYTIDTLDTFPMEDEVYLIMGADAARGLPTWHRWEEVISRVRLAILPRPGIDPQEVEDAVGPTRWLDMPPIAISGTIIRQRAATGTGIRFMVTEPVYEYLTANRLYQDSASERKERDGPLP